eukprot:1572601-Pyramimonas_sp.AAC.1
MEALHVSIEKSNVQNANNYVAPAVGADSFQLLRANCRVVVLVAGNIDASSSSRLELREHCQSNGARLASES